MSHDLAVPVGDPQTQNLGVFRRQAQQLFDAGQVVIEQRRPN